VGAGQAAIVTAVNRITGIYEVEVAVRLVLVANNSLLVYTDSTTDPYSNAVNSAQLGVNQTNIDAVIGDANYDIGHLFTSASTGGLAGVGVVGLSGQKARAATGLSNPIDDIFYVDFVSHEIGHQFRGNHTFNGSACESARNAATAFEPGSGSTIMAYAGTCGSDNIQPQSDPYFHSVSFDEIVAYTTTGVGNAAAVISGTGNNVPRVSAGADFVIPARTPFMLDGAGTDADANDQLTYNWEQRDWGPAQSLGSPDNGTSPLFRSFSATASTARTLPRLANLLNNSPSVGETLPTTNRSLNFRTTVRDNRMGGGGVDTDDALVCSAYESFDGVSAPALPANWTSMATGASAANWVSSTNNSDSPPNNAFVPAPGNISDSTLTSPTIAVTQSNRWISFRGSYNLEPSFDGAVLEIAINGGAFVDILAAGGSFVTGGYSSTNLSNEGTIDLFDLSSVVGRFGSSLGMPLYSLTSDGDGNGVIDLFDLSTTVGWFGATLPSGSPGTPVFGSPRGNDAPASATLAAIELALSADVEDVEGDWELLDELL
jgi:hypothetical protein